MSRLNGWVIRKANTIPYLGVNASDEEKVIFRDPTKFGQALKLANWGPKPKPVEAGRNPEELRGGHVDTSIASGKRGSNVAAILPQRSSTGKTFVMENLDFEWPHGDFALNYGAVEF